MTALLTWRCSLGSMPFPLKLECLAGLRPDFENEAKPGVAMPVVGGEDKYRTTSLLSSDCSYCLFSPENGSKQEYTSVTEHLTLDCTRGASSGYGIVCKK
ncbi:hypothetical protein PTKIN_Ptkin14bG0103800 [Pterospermum kingtungense]